MEESQYPVSSITAKPARVMGHWVVQIPLWNCQIAWQHIQGRTPTVDSSSPYGTTEFGGTMNCIRPKHERVIGKPAMATKKLTNRIHLCYFQVKPRTLY